MLTVLFLREAKIELGEAVASRLKLSEDGTKVLWPQPTDSDEDPQNWTSRRKSFLLLIITLAAIVPDFDSGIGMNFASASDCLASHHNIHQVSRESLPWLDNSAQPLGKSTT